MKIMVMQDLQRYEICDNCHPYFTGKQNLIDTAGRIEKYMEKYNLTDKDIKE